MLQWLLFLSADPPVQLLTGWGLSNKHPTDIFAPADFIRSYNIYPAYGLRHFSPPADAKHLNIFMQDLCA
ncbi:hypothetical protein BGS_0706 [Beggiatoa sp. SS]|nr:hypothetical protein BGS_0706 [Beggiatoa sp. SS]